MSEAKQSKGKTALRVFQGILTVAAATVVADPSLATQFVPPEAQPRIMAGVAVLSALLPSLVGGPAGSSLGRGIMTGLGRSQKPKDPSGLGL